MAQLPPEISEAIYNSSVGNERGPLPGIYAGKISEHTLQELKRLEPNFLPKARKSGYVCPYCGNGTGSDGDGISRASNYGDGLHWKCFKCDRYYDTIELYAKTKGLNVREPRDFTMAIEGLANCYNVRIERDSAIYSTSPLNKTESKHKPLPVLPENIPAELKALKQWVIWKGDKCPLQINGKRASSTNPDTWTSFEQALAVYQSGNADGIGFVIVEGGGIVGIDMDHCVSDNKIIDPQLAGLFQTLASYTELSPSGTGLHILVKGDLKKTAKSSRLEVYHGRRYFTVTGQGSGALVTNQDGINMAYKIAVNAREQERTQQDGATTTNQQPEVTEAEMREKKIAEARAYIGQFMKPLMPNRDIPDREYIGGLFPRGRYSIVASAPGIGKTWFMEYLADLIAHGGSIFDEYIREPLKTLILAGEGGLDMLDRRAAKMHWHNDNKYIHVFDGTAALQARRPLQINRYDGEMMLALMLKDFKPDIVFIDSLGFFFSGDLNKQEQIDPLAMTLVGLAHEYNCAIVANHHIRKRLAKERDLPLDQDDIVGSGALFRYAAAAIGVEGVKTKEGEKEQKLKLVRSLKDWERPKFNEFTYEIVDDGLYGNALRFVINLEPKLDVMGGTKKEQFLEELRNLYSDNNAIFTVKQIMTVTGRSESGVRTELHKWTREGVIKKYNYNKFTVYTLDTYEGKPINKQMAQAVVDGLTMSEVQELADPSIEGSLTPSSASNNDSNTDATGTLDLDYDNQSDPIMSKEAWNNKYMQ